MGTSEVRQLIDEGQRYEAAGSHERALTRYRSAEEKANDPASRSEAIRRQADILRTRSEYNEALTTAEQAEKIAVEHDLHDLAAEAINAQGAVHLIRGDFDRAEHFFTRTLDVSRHLRVRGVALQNLGIIAAKNNDLEKAAQHFKDAHEACKEAGYERGALFALMNYARAVLDQGKGEVAERLLHEAEVLAIHMMDLDSSHLAALNRADAMITRGAYDEAEVLVSSALGYYGNSGNPYRRLDALRLLGDITRLRGSAQQARMFYQAAHDLASKIEAGAEIEVFTKRLAELEG
jgi:tetratricopeptide (TPR) repeat protein